MLTEAPSWQCEWLFQMGPCSYWFHQSDIVNDSLSWSLSKENSFFPDLFLTDPSNDVQLWECNQYIWIVVIFLINRESGRQKENKTRNNINKDNINKYKKKDKEKGKKGGREEGRDKEKKGKNPQAQI